MDEANDQSDMQEIQLRLAKFVRSRAKWFEPFVELADGQSLGLFGGLIRDLMFPNLFREPRDIDIVVESLDFDDFETKFHSVIKRKTRFGGYKLEIDNVEIDVWPLNATWGFKKTGLRPSFNNLPKTTFLNVEAVVAVFDDVELFSADVLESGFFDGMTSKILRINLRENPFPTLNAIRSLITAAKLEFAMDRNLAEFILTTLANVSNHELSEIQVSHYGRIICQPNELSAWVNGIEDSLDEGDLAKLLLTQQRREELWSLRQ